MKKTIISSMVFTLLTTGVFLYSCQKTTSPTAPSPVTTNAFNISVEGNRMAFATVADYEKAVNNPDEETMSSFLNSVKTLSFTPLIKTRSDLKDLIKSDYLASILNEDLAVQIGNHIYRVNPKTEKVYVLPINKSKEYTSLVAEDLSNKNISVYSTGEEVITMVNNGQSSTRCSETGIGGYDRVTNIYPVTSDNTLRFEGQLHFNRYGIYFSLWAEGKIHASNSTNPYYGVGNVHITFNPVYYHARCGTTVGPYYPDGGTANGYRRYNSYQGSKNLNKVYFRAKFEILDYSTSQIKQETEFIEIRQNY